MDLSDYLKINRYVRTLYCRGSVWDPTLSRDLKLSLREETISTRINTCTSAYGCMVNSMITPPPRESRAHIVAECYVIASSPTRSSHTIALVTLCFVYIILFSLSPLFLIPREYPLPCPPLAPPAPHGVTCGADRRKGAWGGVGGDCQGGVGEGWRVV